jgi:hypothetical protein
MKAAKTKGNTHGGQREGSGRKGLSDTEPTLVRSIRLPESDWAKYIALGGSAWFRKALEKAKLPS